MALHLSPQHSGMQREFMGDSIAARCPGYVAAIYAQIIIPHHHAWYFVWGFCTEVILWVLMNYSVVYHMQTSLHWWCESKGHYSSIMWLILMQICKTKLFFWWRRGFIQTGPSKHKHVLCFSFLNDGRRHWHARWSLQSLQRNSLFRLLSVLRYCFWMHTW